MSLNPGTAPSAALSLPCHCPFHCPSTALSLPLSLSFRCLPLPFHCLWSGFGHHPTRSRHRFGDHVLLRPGGVSQRTQHTPAHPHKASKSPHSRSQPGACSTIADATDGRVMQVPGRLCSSKKMESLTVFMNRLAGALNIAEKVCMHVDAGTTGRFSSAVSHLPPPPPLCPTWSPSDCLRRSAHWAITPCWSVGRAEETPTSCMTRRWCGTAFP